MSGGSESSCIGHVYGLDGAAQLVLSSWQNRSHGTIRILREQVPPEFGIKLIVTKRIEQVENVDFHMPHYGTFVRHKL